MPNWTTLLEVAVLIVSASVATISFWSLWHSHIDHRIIARFRMNGVKRLTVHARLIRDISRASCATILTTAAFISLQFPPDLDPLAVVLKITVLLVSFLLGLAVFVEWRWRLRIDAAIDDAERQAR